MTAPVLFLSKEDDWSEQAGAFAQNIFGKELLWERGTRSSEAPRSFSLPRYRVVLSFLSPWIVPAEVLSRSSISINFHPGSCDYPGIGCYNFALYEGAAEFGPVCHYMLPKVDSGQVIAETLFPLAPEDTVETLKLKTMQHMLAMFKYIIPKIAANEELPVNKRQWMRPAFTRRQLNALCEITPEMDTLEQQRRIRATTYPGYPGPYKLVDGIKHYYPVPMRAPLA